MKIKKQFNLSLGNNYRIRHNKKLISINADTRNRTTLFAARRWYSGDVWGRIRHLASTRARANQSQVQL